MLILILEITLLVWGIVSIASGKLTISASKAVGPPAVYFLGIIMLLVLPINILLAFVIGAPVILAGGGMDDRLTTTIMIVEASTTIGTLMIVLVLGAVLGVDPNELQRSRRNRDEDFDDEDDDRPRRRRRRDEDEDDEEDRPRPRPKPEGRDDEGIAPGPPR